VTRRPAAAALGGGLVVALLYVVVAVATGSFSGQQVLPVFDGFAGPQAYRWVVPPPGLEKDNKQPAKKAVDLPLGPNGSAPTDVATDDGQAIVGLDTGSVPTAPPATLARLAMSPVDSATLGPLPDGLLAEGNAYRVAIDYQPSGPAVATLAKPGTIGLTAAAPVDALLFSPDGREWQTVEARPYGAPWEYGQTAPLAATGYYLPAGRTPPHARARGGVPVAVLAPIVGAVVLVMAVAFTVTIRRATNARRRS
jgi:hypothetical protein